VPGCYLKDQQHIRKTPQSNAHLLIKVSLVPNLKVYPIAKNVALAQVRKRQKSHSVDVFANAMAFFLIKIGISIMSQNCWIIWK
jgi:hypothetical protein